MKKICFPVVVVLLFACAKPTAVDVPAHTPRLVVHCFQAQGKPFQVTVGRSIGITQPIDNNEPYPYAVDNAQVLLLQNGVPVDTLVFNSNNRSYESRYEAALGNEYTLKVSAAGFEPAEAVAAFPRPVQPAGVALARNAKRSSGNEWMDEVKLTLADPAGAANHYLMRIKDAYGNAVYCVQTPDKDVEPLGYSDPFSTDECLSGNRLLMQDKNFEGKSKVLVFYVYNHQMEPQNWQGLMQYPTVEVLSINNDYYRYLKSQNAHDNAVDNPFAEPVNVVSNITNGYGFFTTYAKTIDTLR